MTLHKTLFIALVFGLGGFAGWLLSERSVPQMPPVSVMEVSPRESNDLALEGDISPAELDVEQLFVRLMMASGFKPGFEYEYVRDGLSTEQRQALDMEFHKYVDMIFDKRKAESTTIETLRSLLSNTESDKKVLDRLAIVYKEAEQFEEALNTLIHLNHWSQFPEDYASVEQRIDGVIDQYITQLKKRRDFIAQGDLYRYVMDQFPQKYRYKWLYANFLYEQKRYQDAQFVLDELQYVSGYEEKVAQMRDTVQFHIANATETIFPIQLEKRGESYFVNALVNNQEPVKLLIDTGASMTVITPELAFSLGLMDEEPQRYLDFQTANGLVRAAVLSLDSLSLGPYSVSNLSVGIMPFPDNAHIQGLLGMNFLKNYKFYIDQQRETLELITLH